MKRQGTTIVYMGTPEFAVPALSGLIRAGWDVALAVTQPDRPVGRGKKLTHSPVKRCALASGIPVAQPAVLRGNVEFIGRIADLRPDLIVVAAYGKILPRDVLEIPKLGCVNIHASLLPKYRGAAPIHRAVEAGERTTGVTLMYMTEELDAGDIIEAAGIGIAGMNTGQVYDLLAPLGARLLMDALPDIVAGTAGRTAQDCDAATYAPPVDKAEGHIDFAEPVRAIENRIRAMNPFPGAYAFLGDTRVKVIEACVTEQSIQASLPGAVLDVSERGIAVAAKDGIVLLNTIQMPGKKPLTVREYLKGNVIDSAGIFR